MRKTSTSAKDRLSIPKSVWIVVISLIVGAACDSLSGFEWFETHPILKNLIYHSGNSLFSAAILLFLLQLPVIRNEIENYFVAAFSSSDFVHNINPRELTQLVRRLLHARYEPTVDEGYVDTAVDLMDNFTEPYVSSHNENIHVRVSGQKVFKHITKSCTIILRHIPDNHVTLLNLIERRILATRVLFEMSSDSRRFDSLTVKIDNKTVLKISDDVLNAKDTYGDFLVNENLDTKQFDHASVAKWNVLAKRVPDLGKEVKKDQVVTVISSEWRETGMTGATFSHRFHYMTHAPRVYVTVDSGSIVRRIRGFMYGNGLEPDNICVLSGSNSISLQTDGWLYPGCGYTIIIDSSDETTNLEQERKG